MTDKQREAIKEWFFTEAAQRAGHEYGWFGIAEAAWTASRKLALEEERERILTLLASPRRWTEEMDRAWHRAIPDVHKAFADLAAAIRQQQEEGK